VRWGNFIWDCALNSRIDCIPWHSGTVDRLSGEMAITVEEQSKFLERFRTHFAFTQKQESTRLLASECQVRWRCEDSDSIFSLLLCF